jgi:hypothetical protein
MNEIIVNSFIEEIEKIASVMAPVANAAAGAVNAVAKQPGFLRRNLGNIGLMATGAGLYSVGTDAVNDWRTGRMIRKQNDAAQNMY